MTEPTNVPPEPLNDDNIPKPKTAGIVADNYKLDKFKKELDAEGFKYTIVPFIKDISTIKVEYIYQDFGKLKRLIESVNRSF